MEAAGIEPQTVSDTSLCTPATYENCPLCGAVHALRVGGTRSLDMSAIDTELLPLVERWGGLSTEVANELVSLIKRIRK